MKIKDFNHLSREEAVSELMKCCGCSYWANKLADERPFNSLQEIIIESDKIWESVNETGIREAFTHHPKIGDLKSLEAKFSSTKEWAGGEQSGVKAADKETLMKLAEGNDAYEQKFGYIFIVCATGKSAGEMLELLNDRLHNDVKNELTIAAGEQNKITHLRLQKLFQ